MNIFLDCEFTELTSKASLISLALYADEHTFFYAEFNDYDESKLSGWHKENIIKHLEFQYKIDCYKREENKIKLKNSTNIITGHLKTWLQQFDKIEMWGDVPHYDWILFCDLFRGALNIPKNIFFICFDLATLALIKKIDPDFSRFEFAKEQLSEEEKKMQHNALKDAKVAQLCFEKLIKLK